MQYSPNKNFLFILWLKGYLKLLCFSLLCLTGFRLFWFFSYKKGDELSFYLDDFFKALGMGVRFDLSALCYLTLTSLLLWFFWFATTLTPYKIDILKLQRRYWVFILLIYLVILIADFHYYGYFQDHFNVLIFAFFQDDTKALLRTFWKNYPLIKMLLSLIAMGWLLNRWLQKLWFSTYDPSSMQTPSSIISLKPWAHAPVYFLLLLSVCLGARGSFGLFPLEIMHTAISPNSFINSLSFNSAHALVRAFQLRNHVEQKWNENLLKLGYADNPNQALKDYTHFTSKILTPLPQHQYAIHSITSSKTPSLMTPLPHIVFILMESWGADWMSEHSAQFNILGSFEKHKKEDLWTSQILPSSVATIGSLGSLVVDLPHRLFSPFLTESSFLGVEFKQAPARFLSTKGYETHFIYGGNLGWRSIDHFLPKQGFQLLHGEPKIQKHFPSALKENFGHDWGVHDEYVFQYAMDLLKKAKKPQFLFILTTTNHPPYSLPQNYNSPLLSIPKAITTQLIGDPKLSHDRLKAFQYSNHQLGTFLNHIKSSPFKENTILAATGDHSFYIRHYDHLQFFEKWGVPLYLYAPPSYLPSNQVKNLGVGSHIDIFPTLYNLIFSETPYFSLGQDLLDPKHSSWAFHTPSWSSFDDHSGVILNAKGEVIISLCKDQTTQYHPCPLTSSHEMLRKKFTSLMGTADYLFEFNKANHFMSSSANSTPHSSIKVSNHEN